MIRCDGRESLVVVFSRSNATGGGVVDGIERIFLLLLFALSPLGHVALVQRASGGVDLFLAVPSRFDNLDPCTLFDGARCNVVGRVVADGWCIAAESEPALDRLQEVLDDLAADGNLDLHELAALAVDK